MSGARSGEIAVVSGARQRIRRTTASARYYRAIGLDDRALDRLVIFAVAIVVVFRAPAIDDLAAGNGDAERLWANRLAVGRVDLGADAGEPARAAHLMVRQRDPHLAGLRGVDEHEVHLVANQPLDVRRRLGRRWFAAL